MQISKLEQIEEYEFHQLLKFANIIDSVKCRTTNDIIGDQYAKAKEISSQKG
jgi:hypothetical protein